MQPTPFGMAPTDDFNQDGGITGDGKPAWENNFFVESLTNYMDQAKL